MEDWRAESAIQAATNLNRSAVTMSISESQATKQEENPFEDPQIAGEWINSVENERGLFRDTKLYPALEKWAKDTAPKILVDIGSGQGVCADHVQLGTTRYIGVEPSLALVERAKRRYAKADREFVVGNAYKLPVADESADAALSVNVWFHLGDLNTASRELARILQRGGNFLVSTAHPDSYDIWRKMYIDATEDGRKMVGKVTIPVNPLSRNVFYKHTLGEILGAFEKNGLKVDGVEPMSFLNPTRPIFINFFGHKE